MIANLAIHDDMMVTKIMVYPFIEQMKREIEQAESKRAKQLVADVALSSTIIFPYMECFT